VRNATSSTKKGFSLIELLVVMAIVLILAAIGVPNMLRSVMMAHETSAVESLRTLNAVGIEYYSSYGGFPTNLIQLGPTNGLVAYSGAADLVDSVLASGTKSGYTFSWTPGQQDVYGHVTSYAITARPIYLGVTGQRTFYTDPTGIIRYEISNVATVASSPIG
jgi:type IV pilus assembly protein PilA